MLTLLISCGRLFSRVQQSGKILLCLAVFTLALAVIMCVSGIVLIVVVIMYGKPKERDVCKDGPFSQQL